MVTRKQETLICLGLGLVVSGAAAAACYGIAGVFLQPGNAVAVGAVVFGWSLWLQLKV